jgi:hypothetical protein
MRIESVAIRDDGPRQEEEGFGYKSMYLYRNLFRTHSDLLNAMLRLLGDPDFKQLLERQTPSVKAKFTKLAEAIPQGKKFVKEIRDDVCGHVLESAVQHALEAMEWESFGYLDVGEKHEDTRYEFTGEIVAGILLKGVSREERQNGLTSEKYRASASLLPVFGLVEYCLVMYGQDRGLLSMGLLE